MQKIGTFRRNVAKTSSVKATKLGLRRVAKNTARAQVAQATVALKTHTGELLRTTGQYLLGLPQTPEMKDHALVDLGNVGFDLTALARVLKVKLPSSTKKMKLMGTRGAALLQLDSVATNLLQVVSEGLFQMPPTTTITKMVSMPQKGGAKEERQVDVVDLAADQAAEQARQQQMRSFLTGAIDLFWRLCYDMTGQPPMAALEAKVARLQVEYPNVTFDTGAKPVPPQPVVQTQAPKALKKAPKAKAKAQPEPVPA